MQLLHPFVATLSQSVLVMPIYVQGVRFWHRIKCLCVINYFLLSKSFSIKSCFIYFYVSWWVIFSLENSFTSIGFKTTRQIKKIPYLVTIHRFYLFFHGIIPQFRLFRIHRLWKRVMIIFNSNDKFLQINNNVTRNCWSCLFSRSFNVVPTFYGLCFSNGCSIISVITSTTWSICLFQHLVESHWLVAQHLIELER